jgi:hypothetical protein
MAPNTTLNNETICDLKGQSLERGPAAFIKAVDKLLTVGAYYTNDHEQYLVVSDKACQQIVGAIGQNDMMAIEITASGMMVGSQLVDPNHRNVRLLHELLVPLNIARFEISAGLTPADLRQAIAALQMHRLNLGNTSGFQEIKIENLPATVSTASKSVVQGGDSSGALSLDEMFGSESTDVANLQNDALFTDSEKLAREFMEIVGRILDSLETEDTDSEDGEVSAHPDTTPENIRALREALSRLVEVNPDPADLARLIEHAKRALDLSRDPGSVDLVFSLLKKELDQGSDWKYKASEAHLSKPEADYRLTLEELRQEVAVLAKTGDPPPGPEPSARNNYLGICFHLLAADPPQALEEALTSCLSETLRNGEISKQDLSLGSAAVASAVLDGDQVAVDRLVPAFCQPIRESRPEYLAKFWIRLWESLDAEQRALVWPHLVSDLLTGVDNLPPRVVDELWQMAGSLEPKTALRLVSRLEGTDGLRANLVHASLWNLSPTSTYPVHLALMKSSLAPQHGPRLHDYLARKPLNGLTDVLMKAVDVYDPANDGFYLSLIKQSRGDSISLDLRRMAVRMIMDGLTKLPANQRDKEWALRAIGGKALVRGARAGWARRPVSRAVPSTISRRRLRRG